MIKIFTLVRKIDAIVFEVDDLDLEIVFKDLELGWVHKEPVDNIIFGFVKIEKEVISSGWQRDMAISDNRSKSG